MSDPQQKDQANPRPASEHRSPRELARDQAGPTGPKPDKTPPVAEKRAPTTAEQEARKAAVHKSAHAAQEKAASAPDSGSHPPAGEPASEP